MRFGEESARRLCFDYYWQHEIGVFIAVAINAHLFPCAFSRGFNHSVEVRYYRWEGSELTVVTVRWNVKGP